MGTPTLSGPAIVGKFYMVPCLRAYASWRGFRGWIPVLGPEHTDAEHLEFNPRHYHIDWRFVPNAGWRDATRDGLSPLRRVASNSPTAPQVRRLKAKRPMPEFPSTPAMKTPAHRIRWQRLEIAQAFICNKLKPGNICPHRGIDLNPFIKEDGTVVCPGHGLKWDTKTGNLLPHHAKGSVNG